MKKLTETSDVETLIEKSLTIWRKSFNQNLESISGKAKEHA